MKKFQNSKNQIKFVLNGLIINVGILFNNKHYLIVITVSEKFDFWTSLCGYIYFTHIVYVSSLTVIKTINENSFHFFWIVTQGIQLYNKSLVLIISS